MAVTGNVTNSSPFMEQAQAQKVLRTGTKLDFFLYEKVWIIIWTTSIYKVYVKYIKSYLWTCKMFREGKRSDLCLLKNVLIYLFRCVVCVYYRWKWYRECLVCLYLAGCIGLNIASDMQHLFCISSLPQAWPHMKTVPHVCYIVQKASCAPL